MSRDGARMFVRVVPLLRTPFGVDHFDYKLPPELPDLTPGDLVNVPFRKQTVPALVIERMASSPFAAKTLSVASSYGRIRFPASLVGLLHWTAARTFTSQPSVLKAWFRSLPKRQPLAPERREWKAERATKGSLDAQWVNDPEEAIIRRAESAGRRGKRVLIIAPWIARLKTFQERLPGSVVLHSGLNDGDAFRAWHGFLMGTTNTLITTRLGAWLAPLTDEVFLDEPENDDHKQDELAPRYDARLIAAWCASHAGAVVASYGLTPPIHSSSEAPTINAELAIHIRHPAGRSSIPMMQGDTVNALREHEGPRVIIHPIKGLVARFVCRDCGWRASCPHCGFGLSADLSGAVCRACGKKSDPPMLCPSCGGSDLGKSLPGIEKLKQAWGKHEADVAVEWRDLSNEAMDAPLPEHVLVAVTDGSLLGGAGEDLRRRERQCVAFRRLANRVAQAKGRLIIQTEESKTAPWEAWLTTEGMAFFRSEERRDRAVFEYPPAVRLVKLIVDADEAKAETWKTKLETTLGKNATLHGPFAIAFRPSSRRKRFILHAIFPRDTNDADLIRAFHPFAKDALIDLDPIAFFR